MIEINLSPGTRKAKTTKSSSFDVSAIASNALAQIKDPFLGIAVLGIVIGVLGVGAMYLLQSRRESALNDRLTQAISSWPRPSAIQWCGNWRSSARLTVSATPGRTCSMN